MVSIGGHVERMECYSCHARWAPQCYGCHVKVDYSGSRSGYDWVHAGRQHAESPASRAASRDPGGRQYTIPGHVQEQRSFLRFEDPILGINGERRVTPIVPGCQVSWTIVGPDGDTILADTIFRTPPGTEGGGENGQAAIDMAPVQPHTTSKRARSCESCHVSPKAAGYGIAGGGLMRPWNEDHVVDLMTPDGRVIPADARTQVHAVEGLEGDWTQVVTPDGKQLQTVGHHFTGSRPLNGRERAVLGRGGICLGCHVEIPAGSLAVSLLHHVAEVTGQIPVTAAEHHDLVHKVLLTTAWVQVGGGLFAGAVVLLVVLVFILRRRAAGGGRA